MYVHGSAITVQQPSMWATTVNSCCIARQMQWILVLSSRVGSHHCNGPAFYLTFNMCIRVARECVDAGMLTRAGHSWGAEEQAECGILPRAPQVCAEYLVGCAREAGGVGCEGGQQGSSCRSHGLGGYHGRRLDAPRRKINSVLSQLQTFGQRRLHQEFQVHGQGRYATSSLPGYSHCQFR